jgi:hypothetical protein
MPSYNQTSKKSGDLSALLAEAHLKFSGLGPHPGTGGGLLGAGGVFALALGLERFPPSHQCRDEIVVFRRCRAENFGPNTAIGEAFGNAFARDQPGELI